MQMNFQLVQMQKFKKKKNCVFWRTFKLVDHSTKAYGFSTLYVP